MTTHPTHTHPRTVSAHASDHIRFWWHRSENRGYEPDIYRVLGDDERELLLEWYNDTLGRKLVGEMAVPMASALLGFVNGSGVRRIVQLGHFAGYSCLLLGWALRRMGVSNGLFSIDINQTLTDYTRGWLEQAGLSDRVGLLTSDSASPDAVAAARGYRGGDPSCVVIDSSHQFAHTVAELDLWYPSLTPGGLLLLHDASPLAARYDRTEQGGVRRALDVWLARPGAPTALTLLVPEKYGQDGPYADPSGLCLIQKPW